MKFIVVRLIHITALTGKEQPTMTTADQFGHLLRTVDPAGLGTEDTRAY